MTRIKLIGAAIVLTIFAIACGVIWFQTQRLNDQAEKLGAVTEQLENQKAVTDHIIQDAAEWRERMMALEGRQREVHTIYRDRVEVIQSQDPANPSVTTNVLGRGIQEATQ